MTPRRDEHGQSVSLLMLGVFASLLLVAGLVIDGGQRVAAASLAETAAAGAARAAGNVLATDRLGGSERTATAVRAARSYLDGQPGVTGTVTIADGAVTIRTSASAATILLGLIGIDQVQADGYAEADLVASDSRRPPPMTPR